MIPLGATVRWRDAIHKSAWSGVVTGHPRDKMVEVDGRGAISEGLLEVVDVTEDFMGHREVDNELARTLTAEVEALQSVVLQQCEVIAAMSADASEFKRLQACEADLLALRDAVSDALLALTGTRRPTLQDFGNHPTEIWAMAEELERQELPSGD